LPTATSTAVRAGDTVRRAVGPATPAVTAFLRHLERRGFTGAPRPLGLDDRGREILTFVPGRVPAESEVAGIDEAALHALGGLLRELHEASLGFELPPGVDWARPQSSDGGPLVVCHNDVAPRNTVFRGGMPVAFVDWDFCRPEIADWDVGHAIWQFAPFYDDDECRERGFAPPDRLARARAIADGYGLAQEGRKRLTDTVTARIRSTLEGIEAKAARGDRVHRRLVERGVPSQLRRNLIWVGEHERSIGDALGV
jgi:hypothetical protein